MHLLLDLQIGNYYFRKFIDFIRLIRLLYGCNQGTESVIINMY